MSHNDYPNNCNKSNKISRTKKRNNEMNNIRLLNGENQIKNPNNSNFKRLNHNQNNHQTRNPSNIPKNAEPKQEINKLKELKSLAQSPYINQRININRNESMANRKNVFLAPIIRQVRYYNGTIGLINKGNTCYLNSALQNLKNVFLLTKYLLENWKEFDQNRFTFKYCELIANLINQDINQYYDPNDFVHKFIEVAPMFALGQQNDSNFSILYILSLLERELKGLIGVKPYEPIHSCNCFTSIKEINKYNEFQEKMKQKRNSKILEYFYGFQEEIYKCNNPNCKNINYTFQGISVLNLSIMTQYNSPIGSLKEAIEYYQKEQKHYGEKDFFCSKCREKVISIQSKIISLPKIFIINFKRIGENNFYNHDVQIPYNFYMTDFIKNKEYKYELIGLIKHLGGSSSGHNIALCKNFFDSIWYVYDDYRVTQLNNTSHIYYKNNKPELNTTNGFLFFYQNKNEILTPDDKKEIIKNAAELRK